MSVGNKFRTLYDFAEIATIILFATNILLYFLLIVNKIYNKREMFLLNKHSFLFSLVLNSIYLVYVFNIVYNGYLLKKTHFLPVLIIHFIELLVITVLMLFFNRHIRYSKHQTG